MIALLTIALGLALAVGAWRWSARGADDATRVAIVAVLGVAAATFNVVVPVASVEATTTAVLCSALVLGARTGIAVALVALVASSVAGGIGAWTPWQFVALVGVALVGRIAAVLLGPDRDWYAPSVVATLAGAAAVSTIGYDVVVTASSLLSYGASGGGTFLESLASAMLTGLAFTLTHAAFTTAFTVVGAPPLLHALSRARARLDASATVTA